MASAVLAAFLTNLSLTDPGETLCVDSVNLSRGHITLQVAHVGTGLDPGESILDKAIGFFAAGRQTFNASLSRPNETSAGQKELCPLAQAQPDSINGSLKIKARGPFGTLLDLKQTQVEYSLITAVS